MSFDKHKESAMDVNDPVDPTFAERTRQNDIANAFGIWYVAGSRHGLIEGTGLQDADNYLDFYINRTPGAAGVQGFSWRLRVELRVEDSSINVQAKLYDVTSTPAEITVSGNAAISATTWTRQTIDIPDANLVAGGAYYRVRFSKSSASYNAQAIAYLERYAA